MSGFDEQADGRVSNIEHKLAVMDFRMGSNEVLLKEIAEAIKQLVVLGHEQKTLQSEVHDLRNDFEDRKRETNPTLASAERVIGRVYGGIAVFLVFFGIFAYMASNNIERLENNIRLSQDNQTRVLILERDLDKHYAAFNNSHQ